MKNVKKGLNVDVIKTISKIKNEPQWVLDIRLKAYEIFLKLKNPTWGPKLDFIKFSNYIYYFSNIEKNKELPKKILNEFKKLKVPIEEAKYLNGINDQYNSESIIHQLKSELDEKGVIFCSFDEAIKNHSDLVKKYFTKLVSLADNKYAALNTAVFSGGSFIYVPQNVKLDKPLQAYFRINKQSMGQFERTLIICDKNSSLHYIEGCTAPIYDKNNLHAAVVEVFVEENAKCRYTTIQNWSANVLNLVTKRCIVEKNGSMEWIDGNLGSKLNMKYPCTILKGDKSYAKCVSIAVSNKNIIQDTGAKMIHIGSNTHSKIISKTIAKKNGISNYRGLVDIKSNSANSFAEVVCDTLLLDELSSSKTIPTEILANSTSYIKHEAKVSTIDKEKKFFLECKGFKEKEINDIISLGFINDFDNELPLEYSVELKRLLKSI